MSVESELSGFFKQRYGDKLKNLIPNVAKLVKDVSFADDAEQEGELFRQAVLVTYPHGFTYGAANAGAYTLNAGIGATTQGAQVQAPSITLRELVSYAAGAKAQKTPRAFGQIMDVTVFSMQQSAWKRVEVESFYGQVGIMKVASRTNVNATTENIVATLGTFAAGIWAGSKNCLLEIWDSTGAKIGSGTFTVNSVDINNQTIQVTGVAGDITALNTNANFPYDVYYNGARTGTSAWSSMAGVDKIIINTGTLFNIDASIYETWKGQTYSSASSQLTFGKIQSGLALAVNMGLSDKVKIYMNPRTWANVLSDAASARRYDGSYSKKKVENGSSSIEFEGQNGSIELVAHSVIKEGDAFALPIAQMKRLGAQDVSFETPGKGGEIFLQSPTSAGYELRTFTDQQIFIEAPAQAVKFSNIVNV